MMATDITSREDYENYQKAVAAFFEREGIEGGWSTGSLENWDCGNCCHTNPAPAQECEECGDEYLNEPHFSWRPCDCCGGTLGGDRQDVIAWATDSDGNKVLREYSVCVDCEYYAEYGRLDDTTMARLGL